MTTPPMTPEEFRAYLGQLSRTQFSTAKDDHVVQACLAAGEEYSRIWREVSALNRTLQSMDVPAPRRNIAASVMATIANERPTSSPPERDGFVHRMLALLRWEFQVPAWGVAALLLILSGSLFLNLFGARLNLIPASDPTLIAQSGRDTPGADLPQIIHLIPQSQDPVVPVSGHPGLPLSVNPAPSMIIIMGAPPASWLPQKNDYFSIPQTSTKENKT